MIKLIMTWNIREGKETEYLEFLNRDFVKQLEGMGIQPTDAWYQVWGHGKQVLAGGASSTYEEMENALESETWQSFQAKLLTFVSDFELRVVEGTGEFQL